MENASESIKEPGCRRFDVLYLDSDPYHVFLVEVYDNEAAFKAHRASEHFEKCRLITSEMITKREARSMAPIAFNANQR